MSTPHNTYTMVDGVEVLTREGWYLNGQPHRTDGPALQDWEMVEDQVVLTDVVWYSQIQ